MQALEIKNQMMKLWKDTFHDSDEYVSLIFENYFNPEYVECAIDGDRLVAAMIGIPYKFKYHGRCDDNNEKSSDEKIINDDELRGLYLCGLATNPNYRGRGLMSKMIERINRRAADKGFDFTFLIPANEGLIKFYEDRDYVKAFYRINYRFLSAHNFKAEFEARLHERNNSKQPNADTDAKNELIDIKSEIKRFEAHELAVLDVDNQEECRLLNNWLRANDCTPGVLTMQHSANDWDIVFRENHLSGGMIVYVVRDNEICGTAFVNITDDTTVTIPYIVTVDECAKYALLQNLNSLLKSLSEINHKEHTSMRCSNSEIKEVNNDCDFKISDDIVANLREDAEDCSFKNVVRLRNSINDLSRADNRIVNSEIIGNESGCLSVGFDCRDGFCSDMNSTQDINKGIVSDRGTTPGASSISDEDALRGSGTEETSLRSYHMKGLPMGVATLKQDYVIECWSSPYRCLGTESIWRPYYEGVDHQVAIVPDVKNTWAPFSESSRASVYGMLRVLNPAKILKLLSKVASAEKISILNGNLNLQNDIVISTDSGKYCVETVNSDHNDAKLACKCSNGVEKITLKQLSEIIFQAPERPKIVEEAFGLPTLSVQMGLLLD